MTDEISNIMARVNEDLYGPRYCAHCQKVQPVRTYKLEGSDFTKGDSVKFTVGFTGARVCDVCLRTIE